MLSELMHKSPLEAEDIPRLIRKTAEILTSPHDTMIATIDRVTSISLTYESTGRFNRDGLIAR